MLEPLDSISPADEQRVIIKYLTKRGESPLFIITELRSQYLEDALSDRTIYRWISKFKEGETCVTKKTSPGKPTTTKTKENISAIEEVIEEDRRATTRYISEVLNIPKTTVGEIIKEELKMKKVSARWVPHRLDENQRAKRKQVSLSMSQRCESEGMAFLENVITGDETWIPFHIPEFKRSSMQWKHASSPSPKKFKLSPSSKKVLYAMFWDVNGMLLAHPVPEGRTITGSYYATVILPELRSAILAKRPALPMEDVILHHDNAPPHRAQLVKDFLQQEQWELLEHPPYSPDLAPCDFHLFPQLKQHIQGNRYHSRSALGTAVYQFFKAQSPAFFRTGYEMWTRRWKKCLEVEGSYVEK